MREHILFVASILESFGSRPPAKAQEIGGISKSFNLLLTTSHPDSAKPDAGEIALVPIEIANGVVLVDLSEVMRIDSCGIALFLEAMDRITRRGGCLILIRLHEEVRRILETAKLDRVFHIRATREEALVHYNHCLAA